MIYLYYCQQMSKLANSIAKEQNYIRLGEIQWDEFKDGFPNLRVKNVEAVRNKDIVFLASFDAPKEIFKQLAIIYEIPRFAVRSLKIVLPFYPTGTMESVTEEGEIATAATLARMISAIPNTMSGPTQIIIYDIHALQQRFYFSDSIIPRLETAIPILKNRIRSLDNAAIAFPDEGAWKRFGAMFSEYSLITCHKIRKNGKRIVTIKEGDPSGKHVIIVDDLVMTGGTLLECKKVLFARGASKVSAYVTHGVFPQASWTKFIEADFSFFWMTDSCPRTVEAIQTKVPFEVLSLSGSISEIILKTYQA